MTSAAATARPAGRDGFIADIKQYISANCPSRTAALGAIGLHLRRPLARLSDIDNLDAAEAAEIARLIRRWFPERRQAALRKILKKYAP